MDILAILLVILAVAALLAFLASGGTARSLDSFGAGFLPYQGPGSPRGVQEPDPVPWSWPSADDPVQSGDDADMGGPELVEINPRDVAPRD